MKRALAVLVLAAGTAFPQCVMCYRTAEAQQTARARVMNAGILILGAPPFLLLAGFCYLCYRRSQTYADHDKSK